MSKKPSNVRFFFQVADLGIELKNPQLRDGARALLSLVPPDVETVQRLTALFHNRPAPNQDKDAQVPAASPQGTSPEDSAPPAPSTVTTPALIPPPTVENIFFAASPSEVLYNLEVRFDSQVWN